MDIEKKSELIKELAPEMRGTKIEAAFLASYEEGCAPMWECAAKPLEQVAQERAELLTQEKRAKRKLETGRSPLYSYAAK
jgi:hypothetical protein